MPEFSALASVPFARPLPDLSRPPCLHSSKNPFQPPPTPVAETLSSPPPSTLPTAASKVRLINDPRAARTGRSRSRASPGLSAGGDDGDALDGWHDGWVPAPCWGCRETSRVSIASSTSKLKRSLTYRKAFWSRTSPWLFPQPSLLLLKTDALF